MARYGSGDQISTQKVGGSRSSKMKFITAIYGSQYVTFLLAHLYSELKNHPHDNIIVMWSDLPKKEINFLKWAFPMVEFLETGMVIKGDVTQMIPQKLHLWNHACKLYPSENICFIDCDTLLVQSISEFFEDKFDVLFTWKDEKWPLNTGVLLVKNSVGVQKFVEEWSKKIGDIVNDSRALDGAYKSSGGGSQHVLKLILDTEDYDGFIERNICGYKLIFKGIPCKILNETNSVPITKETHIIHYKGGWHPILLDGKPFSQNRPEKTSREMYDYFNQTLDKAKQYISKNIIFNTCNKYVNKFRTIIGGYEERGVLYSEMLAICAICDALDIDVFIESGRARGQSTLTLAKYFVNKNVRFISIELKKDSDALFAEERLRSYENAKLLYGDSRILMPKLVRKLSGKSVAILLDSPKGEEAIKLFKTLSCLSKHISAGFFHDARKGAPIRELIGKQFSQVFFTDNNEYVKKFRFLDKACLPKDDSHVTNHTWRPYMQGNTPIQSYGPTIAIVFPSLQKRLPKVTFKLLEHEWQIIALIKKVPLIKKAYYSFKFLLNK